MFNQNKYVEVFEQYDGCEVSSIGITNIDLNGLNQINDSLSDTDDDWYIMASAERRGG